MNVFKDFFNRIGEDEKFATKVGNILWIIVIILFLICMC